MVSSLSSRIYRPVELWISATRYLEITSETWWTDRNTIPANDAEALAEAVESAFADGYSQVRIQVGSWEERLPTGDGEAMTSVESDR